MPTTRLPRWHRMQSLPAERTPALAEQGARRRAVAPDRQDHVDHGRRNRRGLSRGQRGARPDRHAHRDGVAARDCVVDAVAYALRGAVDLPANGGAGQHRRYADRRPAHRRSERQPPRERDDQRGALAAIFIVRHRVERTLSIDTIVTPQCERLYVGPIRQRNKRGATNTAPERQPPIVPRSILRDRMIDVVVRSTPSSVPIWSSRSLSRSGESARSHAT